MVLFFFFTPPLLHEFQPAPKLFKPLFYLLYVCVCVHQGREGAGGILPPIPSSFQFCSPAFSSKARSYLLPPSIVLFHGCLVGQLFCHAFPLANQSCQPPAPFQKYSRLQPKPSRSSALRHGWQGAFWKQPPSFSQTLCRSCHTSAGCSGAVVGERSQSTTLLRGETRPF